MGADGFHVCYGVRWEIYASHHTEVERLERRQDPRQLAAKRYGLGSWWGSTIEEERCFLLVGSLLGPFGWEGKPDAMLSATELGQLMADVERRLRQAGIENEPAWHYQFEPDR